MFLNVHESTLKVFGFGDGHVLRVETGCLNSMLCRFSRGCVPHNCAAMVSRLLL